VRSEACRRGCSVLVVATAIPPPMHALPADACRRLRADATRRKVCTERRHRRGANSAELATLAWSDAIPVGLWATACCRTGGWHGCHRCGCLAEDRHRAYAVFSGVRRGDLRDGPMPRGGSSISPLRASRVQSSPRAWAASASPRADCVVPGAAARNRLGRLS